MQRNSIIGNVARIMIKNGDSWEAVQEVKGAENGTKVFVNIADHYWSKKTGEQVTRFIPLSGFVPQNLTVSVGQLVDVDFIINTYEKDGLSNVSMDIIRWDVSLRSMNKAAETEAEPAKATTKKPAARKKAANVA